MSITSYHTVNGKRMLNRGKKGLKTNFNEWNNEPNGTTTFDVSAVCLVFWNIAIKYSYISMIMCTILFIWWLNAKLKNDFTIPNRMNSYLLRCCAIVLFYEICSTFFVVFIFQMHFMFVLRKVTPTMASQLFRVHGSAD